MNARQRVFCMLVLLLALMAATATGSMQTTSLRGAWRLNRNESTDIVNWRGRNIQLEIRNPGDAVVIAYEWRRGRKSWSDSLTIVPGREPITQIVKSPNWPENYFMGAQAKVGSKRITKATWLETGRKLVTNTEQVVEVSQGQATIITKRVYAVDQQGDKLTMTETRSTRRTPIKLVFDRVIGGTDD